MQWANSLDWICVLTSTLSKVDGKVLFNYYAYATMESTGEQNRLVGFECFDINNSNSQWRFLETPFQQFVRETLE